MMNTGDDEKVNDQKTATNDINDPDPTWKDLYRVGGISAILYVILGIIVPGLLLIGSSYSRDMDGAALLQFIAANRTWWMVIQTLTLLPSILAIVVFLALYVALKHINKSYAAVGALVAIVCEILFMAFYPITLGLVYLSDQYAVASDAQRIVLVNAAGSLLAQNNAFNPAYDIVFVAGILIISLVMRKGVFPKRVAYLGMATAPAALIGLALWPVIGIGYFWWWFVYMVWFIAVGWKLYNLGKG